MSSDPRPLPRWRLALHVLLHPLATADALRSAWVCLWPSSAAYECSQAENMAMHRLWPAIHGQCWPHQDGWDQPANEDEARAQHRAWLSRPETRQRLREQADPECAYCGGEGLRYWHADDCDDEHCALAGGVDDCDGQIEECPCTETDDIPF